MTAGIITYHYHYNYGTMLQAFALQKVISDLGVHAEIINFYQPNELSREKLISIRKRRLLYYLTNPSYVTNKLLNLIALKASKKKVDSKQYLFDEFYHDNIILSEKKYSSSDQIEQDPPIYDVYIVGSDQTWNPYCGGNPDAFYLTFAPDDKRRVSYAPSMCVSRISNQQKERLKVLFQNIECLSCREEIGAEIIEEITGRKVTIVLDPTFLLDAYKWSAYEKRVSTPTKYILQYFLGDNKLHRKYVKKLARMLNVPILSIPTNGIDIRDSKTLKSWCGPSEFLYLIRNAELICTDSFHGSALSINYRKPVYSFYKRNGSDIDSDNNRLDNLYSMFNIPNRIITDYNTLPQIADVRIDYNEKIEQAIQDRYEYSMTYLKGILGKL